MATESDLVMQDLDCKPESTPVHVYDRSQVLHVSSAPVEGYEDSQVQQLLHLTESLMEQGRTLNGELDVIPSNDQDEQPVSESHKNRFMLIVMQFIFILQQALLVFPELLEGRAIQSKGTSFTWQLLQDDELDIDSLLIQCFLLNKQNCLACVKFIEMEEGTWVRPKSRFYFYKFFLELYDNGRWQDIMKMSQKTFFWFCNKLAPHVRKSDTNYRQAIPVPCRLSACIYKLVTGCRSAEIMSKFGIGRSTLYSILRQVIPGIIELMGSSIRWPTGQAFHVTANGIQEICSFPNCGGVVGGCDIPIVAPTEDPWAYMNVNQEYSIALQAVCNHERKFTSVNVGKAGSMEYLGVLRSSSLFEKADSGALLKENGFTLPCGSQLAPYLIGDSGYPCLDWLLTPYRQSSDHILGPMQVYYNEKLLQGKGLVDQSFAMLKSTFRELATPCLLDIELVPQMIGACCVLHNILIDRKDVQADDLVVWSEQQALILKELESSTFEAETDLLEENQEALIKRDTLAYYLMNLQEQRNGPMDSSANLAHLTGSLENLQQLGDEVQSPNLSQLGVRFMNSSPSPNLLQQDESITGGSLSSFSQLEDDSVIPSGDLLHLDGGIATSDCLPQLDEVIFSSRSL